MKLQKPEKLKSGAYRIRMRLNGKNVSVYGETEAQCRQKATLIKSEHLSGKVIQKRCDYTVKQAVEAYIASKPKLSPSTIRGYETIKRTRFNSVMEKKIDDIDWQNVIDNEDCSPKTLQNAWGLIKSAMRYIEMLPPKVELPKVISEERPFLEPEDIPVFLKAIHGTTFELAALLGLHSLRRSELCDLTYDDINLKKQTIRVKGAAVLDKDGHIVHKETNKNETSTRIVPIMIPRLLEILQEQLDGGAEGYIIPHHPNSIYGAINAVCEKNNLPLIGCHGLRHTFVSLAFHLQWSIKTTMRVGGYKDDTVVRKIYYHLAQSDKDNDILSMQAFFQAKTSA